MYIEKTEVFYLSQGLDEAIKKFKSMIETMETLNRERYATTNGVVVEFRYIVLPMLKHCMKWEDYKALEEKFEEFYHITKPVIKPLCEHTLHESWGGWENFLSSCELVEVEQGVVFYHKVNCNYILFPDGTLVENFGIWGKGLMNEVKVRGQEIVLKKLKEGKLDSHYVYRK